MAKSWGHQKKQTRSHKLLEFFNNKKGFFSHKKQKSEGIKGDWRIPTSRVKVRFFESRFGRQKKGDYDEYIADKWGFIRFHYIPEFFQVSWRFEIEGKRQKLAIPVQVETEGYQIVMDLAKVLIGEKELLVGQVEGLKTRGVVHFDFVQLGRRLWSQQFPIHARRADIKIAIPKGVKGLCSVQVYTEFFFPGNAYDARLIYIGKPKKKKIMAELRKHLIFRGDGMKLLDLEYFSKLKMTKKDLSKWARYLFASAKARFVAPILLDESSEKRRKSLRAAQKTFRDRTILSLGALSFLVILGMFGWMLWGYRRDRLLIKEAAEQGIGELETRGFFIIILSFVLFALIFSGILYVLWAMKWTYDFI